MRAALLIARRELSGYLMTFSGYVIIAAMLGLDALMFNAWAIGEGSKRSAEVLSQFFYLTFGTTLVASIFISMRLLAEERQTGTLALLYSDFRERQSVIRTDRRRLSGPGAGGKCVPGDRRLRISARQEPDHRRHLLCLHGGRPPDLLATLEGDGTAVEGNLQEPRPLSRPLSSIPAGVDSRPGRRLLPGLDVRRPVRGDAGA